MTEFPFNEGKDEKSDQIKNTPHQMLNHITSRWGLLVLIALDKETLRFNELRKKIDGVSEKMLIQTLKLLEEDGFVLRVSYPIVPPRVEYSLTTLGSEIKSRILSITDWLELNLHTVNEQNS